MSDVTQEKNVLYEHNIDSTGEKLSTRPSSTDTASQLQAEINNQLTFRQKCRFYFTFKNPPLKKNKFFFWYPPGTSNSEKKLVFKLDVTILTYVCVSYFIRYLDQSNLSVAFVNGMEEELNLTNNGGALPLMNMCFNIGYALGGIPSNILITKVNPHIVIPLFEIFWSCFTVGQCKAKNLETLCALRFFQGIFEGTIWPAVHYILGSWYTSQELSKRTSIYISSGTVGTMFASYIQTAINNTFKNKNGMSGWRWLFIIDGLLTVPVALFGFFFTPDIPCQAKPRWWLNEEEIELASKRVKSKEQINKLDSTVFKRLFLSWQFWFFVPTWTLWGYAILPGTYWNIALKRQGYNSNERTNWPTILNAVGIVTNMSSGWLLDLYRERRGFMAPFILLTCLIWILGLGLIINWNVKDLAHPRLTAQIWAGYALQATNGFCSPIIVSWLNLLSSHDHQLRAITLGAINTVHLLLNIPVTLTTWDSDNAPRYRSGHLTALISVIFLTIFMFAIYGFDQYTDRVNFWIEKERIVEDVHDNKDPGDLQSKSTAKNCQIQENYDEPSTNNPISSEIDIRSLNSRGA